MLKTLEKTPSIDNLSIRRFPANEIILGDAVEELAKLPDESIDLIVADPPYWKVINESWDYQWRKEEEYIDWSKKWFQESYRVLRKGGTFYLFGYFRTLALLLQPLQSIGFELRQQIIIDKGMRSVSGRATKNYRMFPNVTESVIFLIKDSKPFIKSFLKEQQLKLGYNSRQINEMLGVKSNGGGMWSIYTGENVCEQVPTRELWGKLQKVLKFDLPYESVSMVFNAQMGLTDVWKDIDFYKEERFHPTQKPLSLIQRLISASSDEGMVVLDPFLGGGSTALAAKMLSRNYIGIELDSKYVEIARDRIADLERNKSLF